MKLSICWITFWPILTAIAHGQTRLADSVVTEGHVTQMAFYAVQGTTPEREWLLRAQIEAMQPALLPSRIIFVPHCKYLYATKMYHLHVPTGMSSKMFTHLPSRSVYIDDDFYAGADWLAHWMAHELGHLEYNNADEGLAEKAAAKYRRRLELNPVSERMASR